MIWIGIIMAAVAYVGGFLYYRHEAKRGGAKCH